MSHLSEEQLDQLIAAERSRVEEPLNSWRTIAARAREEGLIRESERSRFWRSGEPWVRAAAAILLLVGGIGIGRATIGLPSGTTGATASTAVTDPPSNTAAAPASISNTNPSPASNISFASVDEASAALDRAVLEYQRASQFIAANNLSARTSDSAAVYRARAEALDKIVNATKSALQGAPHDPVLNQYYLATMGAQAATRQVVSVGLRGF